MTRSRALALLCAPLLAGCGASTLRVEAAPTVDTQGRPGFESILSLGLGTPLDFHGRSHHFLQARAGLGGGLDGRSARGAFVAAGDVDYIYWASPRIDVRTGLRGSYRRIPSDLRTPDHYGVGGHLGILPIVWGDEGNWIVGHLCVGPELRLEYLWSAAPDGKRGVFSLPLVVEFNLFAAGD